MKFSHHLVLCTAACLLACATAAVKNEALNALCQVVGIIDGDTFTARCPNQQVRVRFASIDAPESGQAYSRVSRQYLSMLIFRKRVWVVQSKAEHSYNRIVANVYDERGQDVVLLMVRAGLAWHYKHFAHEQTPAARTAYALAEDAARQQKLGLWIDPQAQAPWDWRHQTK